MWENPHNQQVLLLVPFGIVGVSAVEFVKRGVRERDLERLIHGLFAIAVMITGTIMLRYYVDTQGLQTAQRRAWVYWLCSSYPFWYSIVTFIGRWWRRELTSQPKPQPKPQTKPQTKLTPTPSQPPKKTAASLSYEFASRLSLFMSGSSISSEIRNAIASWHGQTAPKLEDYQVNAYQELLSLYGQGIPKAFPLVAGRGAELGQLREEVELSKDERKRFELNGWPTRLPSNLVTRLDNIKVQQVIPANKRTEHTFICAGSGRGKTTLLESMLADDLATDASIMVIDSEGGLISKLLEVVPEDRIVHILPEVDYPLALNLFAPNQDLSLFERIFTSLDTSLTGLQAPVYRHTATLVSRIPDGNIFTLQQLLREKGATPYRDIIEELDPITRDFFLNEFDKQPEYKLTKQAILRRLQILLTNPAFVGMFSATENKFDLDREVMQGKVILIDAQKSVLNEGFSIFAKFFIAQLMKFVRSIPGDRPLKRPFYVYMDEFQEYAGEEDYMMELFGQARKRNIGVTVALQNLYPLPEGVKKAIMASTSLKFVADTETDDLSYLARQMRCDPDDIRRRPRGVFMGYVRDVGTSPYGVTPGKLDKLPRNNNTYRIREKMREKYSYQPQSQATRPTINPDPFADFQDRT